MTPSKVRTLRVLASALFPILLVASALRAPARAQSGVEAEERPNIVFIFSDDHAVQALGAYEDRLSPLNPSPEIDRLAEEGMLF